MGMNDQWRDFQGHPTLRGRRIVFVGAEVRLGLDTAAVYRLEHSAQLLVVSGLFTNGVSIPPRMSIRS